MSLCIKNYRNLRIKAYEIVIDARGRARSIIKVTPKIKKLKTENLGHIIRIKERECSICIERRY